MKKRNALIFGLLALSISFFTGCNKTGPVSPTNGSLSKSSTLKISATPVHKTTPVNLASIPVTGGTIDLQVAWINFKDLVIQENSGFDGEQQGEHHDGNQNDGGPETENPDITAPGPFTVDISSGNSLIGSFQVYPGTFKKVDFTFTPNPNDPFFGKTIVMSGQFTPTVGSPVPFTLKSDFSSQIQQLIANGGIIIPADSTVEINVVFDLAGWFSSVDFSNAVVTNGEILIDSQNNQPLLAAFEAQLTAYVDVEEGGESGD